MSTTEAPAVGTLLDTAPLKKFAQSARQQLLEQVRSRLAVVLAEDSLARRESAEAVAELEKRIADTSEERVIEQVAYTWFNRFCALRFMDANRYTRIGTVSPVDDHTQPEILMEAKQGHIDDDWGVDAAAVMGLLDGTTPSDDPQQEAYRLLLVAVCNHYNVIMPFMFEQIADYTELLLPDDLLSDHSVLSATREALSPEACEDVEVIGWLYQFYISEKKDDVFAALKKGKKITPENIPAATQLFTPHWIVRYLVENSLGRLWMLNHPDSRLIEQMDYYIRPEEPETDFLRISSPEEIKICDPACGSGHMLTYAFALLYAIYEEQGHQATDIPRLILTHNLYGIEIDQRAGALAAFALTMKARDKYRRFLTGGKVVQPNICVLENISIDPEDLEAYMDKVGRDLFSGGLQGVVHQWEEADNFGSLIRPLVTDVSEVLELLRERQMSEDLFLAGVHQKVLTALRQAEYLSPRYHVVVANPPYMGKGQYNPQMTAFSRQFYKETRVDLFAMFMERATKLTLRDHGLLGFITMHSWMFLSSFYDTRRRFVQAHRLLSMAHLGARAFSSISGEVVQTTAFVVDIVPDPDRPAQFIRAVNETTPADKALRLASGTPDFTLAPSTLSVIPSWPLAYWLPPAIIRVFAHSVPLSDITSIRAGMATGDNSLFVRHWAEVGFSSLGLGFPDRASARNSNAKWFPFNKGGPYRKWYGNLDSVVNFQNDGDEIKTRKRIDLEEGRITANNSMCYNQDFYFRASISWSKVSSSAFSVRVSPAGMISSDASNGLFPEEHNLLHFAAFLNSGVVAYLMRAINPTLNIQVGNVASMPWWRDRISATRERAVELAGEAMAIAKLDWDGSETSWDFSRPLLLNTELKCLRFSDAWEQVESCLQDRRMRLKQIERENTSLFVSAYLLEDAIPREHLDQKAALRSADVREHAQEFVSYAVGCMLGRYSLDKPGLILANQGETADDYRQQIPEPTFAPDEDNVIPLLDGDWFEDDVTERFREFLKVTFGTEHYEENLTFLENALYPDNLTGKKRKTIRDYFLKEFYNHHIKLYKKRPIYWLFSSPKGTFNALIYMHRYRPDTVSVVLNDYLREYQTKLKATVEHEQSVADSASASQSDKTKALKRITTLKKDLKELEDYERDILYPLATQRIEIDLDDGVKVNYNKFGKALKKVTGLSGKV